MKHDTKWAIVRVHENLGERIFDVLDSEDERLDSMQKSMVDEAIKTGDLITCGMDVFEPRHRGIHEPLPN